MTGSLERSPVTDHVTGRTREIKWLRWDERCVDAVVTGPHGPSRSSQPNRRIERFLEGTGAATIRKVAQALRVLTARRARWLASVSLAAVAACGSMLGGSDDSDSDSPGVDAAQDPSDATDGSGDQRPRTLYPEDVRHSPITTDGVVLMAA